MTPEKYIGEGGGMLALISFDKYIILKGLRSRAYSSVRLMGVRCWCYEVQCLQSLTNRLKLEMGLIAAICNNVISQLTYLGKLVGQKIIPNNLFVVEIETSYPCGRLPLISLRTRISIKLSYIFSFCRLLNSVIT